MPLTAFTADAAGAVVSTASDMVVVQRGRARCAWPEKSRLGGRQKRKASRRTLGRLSIATRLARLRPPTKGGGWQGLAVM